MSDTSFDEYSADADKGPLKEDRVLSCQSWVCHGYVGNKCSVFGLQTLGVEVDPILTVQFSNHTGYPSFKGQVLSGDQLKDIFQGLVANHLHRYSHLLTGYINSPTTLRAIMDIYHTLKKENPQLQYLMGDEGKMYVTEELAGIYRTEVVPHADYLFPNQMEAEIVTETKIDSDESLLKASEKIHDMGVPNVLITSTSYRKSSGEIELFCSCRPRDGSQGGIFRIRVPKFDRYFTGTGDLLASLVLAWVSTLSKDKDMPQRQVLFSACERAVNGLYGVLEETMKGKHKELRLIQNRKHIESPELKFRAQWFHQ
ncbi:hypothetical protein PROFUN_03096 [Planoprotostelium fungivorum]|uniref:pyridoxal kinase n=1 Tax=Planoprotostelium fungivorum TaxID=1890364 RepID=A0A2P6NQ76_9EUKA|nr:hypothetical protein PROFUN_03096 [Planoprotostelium fungivorum]